MILSSFWAFLWANRQWVLRAIAALAAAIGGHELTVSHSNAPEGAMLAAGDAPAVSGWLIASVVPFIASFLTGPMGQGAFEKAMARVFSFVRSKGPVDPTVRIVAALNLGNACMELNHDNPDAKKLAQDWKEKTVAALMKAPEPVKTAEVG